MKRFTSKIITLCTVIMLFTGCQVTKENNAPINYAILQDAIFELHEVEEEQDIYRLDAEIVQQLDTYVRQKQSPIAKAKHLLNFLMDNGQASLSYQTGANLTATQAYNDLNANCLSLSILAHSLAQHLGLRTQFQDVNIPEYWDQVHGYSLLTGHVNLTVSADERKPDSIKMYLNQPKSITVDFDPNSRSEKFSTTKISKSRISAMFYNNKGAMHMIKHQYNRAYSYFKAAIETDPHYSGTWGNLGILYRLKHQYDLAEQSYEQALSIKPENYTVLGNKAVLYQMTSRVEQANKIKQMLHNKRRNNPYYLIVLGNEALKENSLDQARAYFTRAKRLDNTLHESYFGLAKVNYYEGDFELTEFYLSQALKHAPFDHDQKRYTSKLSALHNFAER